MMMLVITLLWSRFVMSAHCVSGPGLKFFILKSHIILANILRTRYYYLHFIDQLKLRLSNLPQITQKMSELEI